MKVVMLIPCLMLPNNKEANHDAMAFAQKHYPVDEFIVNDAEFDISDYKKGFTYIGHHKERQGFVKTRNQLLEYFYNSDADYAIWMDANKRVSAPTLNDFITLIEATKKGMVNVDAVFSTLGIWVSGERMQVKQMPDYFDYTYLVNYTSGYDWFHGLMMKNLKKHHGIELYIDERCDPRVGTPEDVYFARFLKRVVNYRLAAGVCINAPSNKTSTWMSNKIGYDYPKVDYALVDKYVNEKIKSQHIKRLPITYDTIKLPRDKRFKELLKPYQTRARKVVKKPNKALLTSTKKTSTKQAKKLLSPKK